MKSPLANLFQFTILLILGCCSLSALSSAVISGTRVIYPSDSKDVSVRVSNNGPTAILLQSWIDDGNQDSPPAEMKVPFIITPPINRVDSGKGQTLRISYTGDLLPVEKESLFWLNVLEIPAKKITESSENTLQVAFRSRLKLFFRPSGLQGNANDAPKQMRWRSKSGQIEAYNPTPYFINLVTVMVNGKKIEGSMISPMSHLLINIKSRPGDTLSGKFVNDYGAVTEFNADVE